MRAVHAVDALTEHDAPRLAVAEGVEELRARDRAAVAQYDRAVAVDDSFSSGEQTRELEHDALDADPGDVPVVDPALDRERLAGGEVREGVGVAERGMAHECLVELVLAGARHDDAAPGRVDPDVDAADFLFDAVLEREVESLVDRRLSWWSDRHRSAEREQADKRRSESGARVRSESHAMAPMRPAVRRVLMYGMRGLLSARW